ncbi:hypothetical protein [Rhodoplanes azumiensis]|uniref:Uncharacterized protein n=1 Tax=Rhodoplanes azumiensis TaxID=1897628 RepID=A0ABW5AH06_9BRAD
MRIVFVLVALVAVLFAFDKIPFISKRQPVAPVTASTPAATPKAPAASPAAAAPASAPTKVAAAPVTWVTKQTCSKSTWGPVNCTDTYVRQ